MRAKRLLLGSTAGVFAVAALAYCCGSYGDAKGSIKVNRPMQTALVRDGRLYAVNDQGELFTLVRPDGDLRPLGKFGGDLLDIAGGKGCFAVRNMVYVADLAKGTILGSQTFEHLNNLVCFVGPDRLAVLKACSVEILDAGTAKTIHTIELKDSDKEPAARAIACRSLGDRLYVATYDSLVVIDAHKNTVVERIPIEMGHVLNFHVQKDNTILASYNHGAYGAWVFGASSIDLKTRKATALKLPAELKSHGFGPTAEPRPVLAIGPDNHFCIVGPSDVFEYDAKGKLIGQALPKTEGRVLTLWNGSAVIAGKESLEIVPLSVKTARSE